MDLFRNPANCVEGSQNLDNKWGRSPSLTWIPSARSSGEVLGSVENFLDFLRTVLPGPKARWSRAAELVVHFYTHKDVCQQPKDFFSRRAFPIPLLMEGLDLSEVTMKRKRTLNLNFPNLKRLAEERPTKVMKALRLVWPRIKGALDQREPLGNIQRQVAEMGITVSYKVLQIYVSRLRREDRLKNRLQPIASRESKVPTAAGRRASKPIGFVIPGSQKPVWTDLTCSICRRDILSCRCSNRNGVC